MVFIGGWKGTDAQVVAPARLGWTWLDECWIRLARSLPLASPLGLLGRGAAQRSAAVGAARQGQRGGRGGGGKEKAALRSATLTRSLTHRGQDKR